MKLKCDPMLNSPNLFYGYRKRGTTFRTDLKSKQNVSWKTGKYITPKIS